MVSELGHRANAEGQLISFFPFISDAQRPCSTCVRSHSYAVAHAPAGADLPPFPECTFDEGERVPLFGHLI